MRLSTEKRRSANDAIWTISALNFEVKTMLSEGVGSLWIEGEVSNFVQPASGHWYFSLKDNRAQCRAAMFKGCNSRIGFTPKNGQQVIVYAQVTLYEARGEYQLVVDHLEDAGVGALKRLYEQLKNQLAEEGLFAPGRKKPLPAQPRHIGIITSPTGAAIRDALSVIRRRAPHIPVTLVPTMVQGEQAAEQIRCALARLEAFGQCDLVLMIRGGGSLEDMWCFNDEALARDMARFPLPIVTGIGHEIDFTIADFVADVRAPTPSAAAETVTPDRHEIMQNIDECISRLWRQVQGHLTRQREYLCQLQRNLNHLHPQRQLGQFKLRLQFATAALFNQLKKRMECNKQKLEYLGNKNIQAARQRLLLTSHQLALQTTALDTLSPLKTLSRGFTIVEKDNHVISSVKQLDHDDEITITLLDGKKQAAIL